MRRNSWSCLLALLTFAEGLRWGAEIYHALKSVLKSKGYVDPGRR